MSSRPAFRGTSLDSPVTKVGLPLLAVQPQVAGRLPGTACLVAPWFAMTARHVIEDFASAQPGAEHLICTQVVTDHGKTVLPLFVHRLYYAQPYDIAFLHLVPAGPIPRDHVWECPRLDLLPPRVGPTLRPSGTRNRVCRKPRRITGRRELTLRPQPERSWKSITKRE